MQCKFSLRLSWYKFTMVTCWCHQLLPWYWAESRVWPLFIGPLSLSLPLNCWFSIHPSIAPSQIAEWEKSHQPSPFSSGNAPMVTSGYRLTRDQAKITRVLIGAWNMDLYVSQWQLRGLVLVLQEIFSTLTGPHDARFQGYRLIKTLILCLIIQIKLTCTFEMA